VTGTPPSGPETVRAPPRPGSLPGLARYFLRLGTVGFGGPIALVGYMQRDLVEARGWITVDEYKEGLALAQLAPGPLAAQLAIYLGYVRGRVVGATVAGLAFIGPSFAMVLALSALYLRFGGIPWMQAAFYGIGAAVIAIIVRSVLKLVRLTAGRRPLLFGIIAANMAVTAWTERELLWVFLLSGLVPMLRPALAAWHARPAGTNVAALAPWPWLVTGLGAPASGDLLARLFGFFAKAGLVVFGSGLAVVPFLHGGVVQQYRWLTERQFLDAVAVSMITPGPVVITVAFIGYLVAGPLGGLVAAVGVFLPTYLTVVVAAPTFHRVAENAWMRAFVDGVTSAATGAIAGAAVVLGRRALVDGPTVAIAVITLVLLLRLKQAREPWLILGAGALGFLFRGPGA